MREHIIFCDLPGCHEHKKEDEVVYVLTAQVLIMKGDEIVDSIKVGGDFCSPGCVVNAINKAVNSDIRATYSEPNIKVAI